MRESISVIIPTLARRPVELERAIASVLRQDEIKAVPIVVLNGANYDPEFVNRLRRRSDIQFRQIELPSVSSARHEGRRCVETPFFAFLDDDDELLPNAMRVRQRGLAEGISDVVVTNGYYEQGGRRTLNCPNFGNHPEDPALAILEENWLASAGGLYRTNAIGEQLLQDLPDILEWTYFGFLLAQQYRVNRVDEPTYVIHTGAADQVTRSWRFQQEAPNVLMRMERLTTRPELRARLRQKRSAAWHSYSVAALERGNLADAWKSHIRSLMVGGGIRYLPYGRRLLGPLGS